MLTRPEAAAYSHALSATPAAAALVKWWASSSRRDSEAPSTEALQGLTHVTMDPDPARVPRRHVARLSHQRMGELERAQLARANEPDLLRLVDEVEGAREVDLERLGEHIDAEPPTDHAGREQQPLTLGREAGQAGAEHDRRPRE